MKIGGASCAADLVFARRRVRADRLVRAVVGAAGAAGRHPAEAHDYAGGEANIVLDVGGAVGNAGEHVIGLEDAPGEAAGDADVYAAASAACEAIADVEAGVGVGADTACERLAEHRELLAAKGDARAGHVCGQAEVEAAGVDVGRALVTDVDHTAVTFIRVPHEAAGYADQREAGAHAVGGVG